jgi:hypothetical protein
MMGKGLDGDERGGEQCRGQQEMARALGETDLREVGVFHVSLL